jgi:hypothetical protein
MYLVSKIEIILPEGTKELRFKLTSVLEFKNNLWGFGTGSGIGLPYQPVRLHRPSGPCDNSQCLLRFLVAKDFPKIPAQINQSL